MTICSRTTTLGTLLALGALITACGNDSSSASSDTTAATTTSATAGSSELCDERSTLRTSIEDLRQVDVVKNGTSALDEPLAEVKESLEDVKAQASSDIKPEVEALGSAIQQVEDALENRSADGIAAVATAAQAAVPAANALLTSLDSLKCD